MGDRGQVCIEDENVWLYSHWGAYDLPLAVQDALKKKWRWNDPEYLARIIFDEMTINDHGEETGFGIGTSMHGDVWRVVYVNCSTQTVKVVDHGNVKLEESFEDFIKNPTVTTLNEDDD